MEREERAVTDLREMLDEATPGPWRPSKSYRALVSDSPSGYDDAESVHAYGGHMVCESVQEHNRRLIALAPDLAAEVLALREENAKLGEALAFYADENRHGLPSNGPWGLGSDDFGKRARAALSDIKKITGGGSDKSPA